MIHSFKHCEKCGHPMKEVFCKSTRHGIKPIRCQCLHFWICESPLCK